MYKLLQPLQTVRVEMTTDQSTSFNAYFADIQTRQLQFSDTLPENFDRKEYLRFAQILGIPPPSADRYVKKCHEERKLEKVEHGKYRKRGNEEYCDNHVNLLLFNALYRESRRMGFI